jgi:hypothetical protein
MPIYFFGAPRETVVAGLPQSPLRSIPIDDTAAHLNALAEIDAGALGVARENHHRYLLSDPATTCAMLFSGSECVGYAYISSNGQIGPLAVTRADVLGDAFATGLRMAVESSAGKISAFLPGTCVSTLSLAVRLGMRISFPMLLMASPGYGDWTLYLPRNPGFM